MIVATLVECRSASFLLKTLFFHRRSPLHLHILVNDVTRLAAKTLLDTWELNEVAYSFYTVDKGKAPSLLLTKFRIPQIISSSLAQRIVYFDNDVRLLDDVSVLWRQIGNETDASVGLITHSPCDSEQEFCFDDRIIMFNLQDFRRSPMYTSLVNASTEGEVKRILSENRSVQIFRVPCEWMVAHLTSCFETRCPQRSNCVKALVQSELTSFSGARALELAREHVLKVLDSEPTVLAALDCTARLRQESPGQTPQNSSDKCAKYKYMAFLKRRTHLCYLGDCGGGGRVGPDEVSLLTQLTMDRFEILERMLTSWTGPASVVLYLDDAEAVQLPAKVARSAHLRSRKSVAYHVVYKRQIYNPINYLRNVLVNNSRTPFAFFVDIDLVPSRTLYEHLKQLVRKFMSDPGKKQLLVVPAFQMFDDLKSSTPTNKKQLLPFLSNETIVGYGMKRNWKLGHRPTDYARWVNATQPYQATFANAYEPYVVIRQDNEARYNEVLLERMGDKNAYSRLLYKMGYKFFVIPEDFIVHIPHPMSAGSALFYGERNYYQCSTQLHGGYAKEIDRRFPDRKL